MDGLLVIDKPEGLTSFDVVAEVRRHLHLKKAGHTGTLDPMATGVLPVCLGDATRLVPFIVEGEKAYEATVRLGAATDTQDRTGKIVSEAPVPPLTAEQIEPVLARFRGEIDQAPPMYSAVRVAGKRLYELAREGKQVERATRKVTVHALTLAALELPRLRLSVRCSKGTYVRTLAHDIGEALGCHAHLSALRRTESGGFTLDQAVPLGALRQMAPEEVTSRILTPNQALSCLPAVQLPAALAAKVPKGQTLPVEDLKAQPLPEGRRVRLVSEAGDLLAVAEWKNGGLSYVRVLVRSG